MPETPPAPKTEIHIKPVWNGLDQPVWIIATSRHSSASRLVEQSPVYTRLWRSDWGWEIDHSEFREVTERLRTMHTLCPQCLVGVECENAEWRLWKIGVRPRRPDEKRAPKDEQRYQYQPPPKSRSQSAWERDFFGEGGRGRTAWDDLFGSPPQPAGMSPAEAAAVLGLAWPIEREGAGAVIKAAFSKTALTAHVDSAGGSGDSKPMILALEARKVLNEWAGVE